LIWVGGDYIDFYAISRWDRSPKRKLELQHEINQAVVGLRELRQAAPDSRIVFQEGNHEYRLRRFLWNRVEELAYLDVLKLPELLKFAELAIEYVEYGFPTAIGHLWHIHGDEIRGGSINYARGKLIKLHQNVIFGHHHRFQTDFIRSVDGKVYGAWANGCLCGMRPDYDIAPQWTQGLTLVQYTESGLFHVSQLPFFFATDTKKLSTVVNGVLLSSDNPST
jgi:hypothetical protein